MQAQAFQGVRPSARPAAFRPAAVSRRPAVVVAATAVAAPATLPFKAVDGSSKGTQQLSLKVAEDTAKGLVHRYMVLVQQNARQVREEASGCGQKESRESVWERCTHTERSACRGREPGLQQAHAPSSRMACMRAIAATCMPAATQQAGAPPHPGDVVVHVAAAAVPELNQRHCVCLPASQGTASTLTRMEVRGGGKKPYAQKGTGNARRGSNVSPLFPGGGVSFGPKVRCSAARPTCARMPLARQSRGYQPT